jgi:hypothetical protein
MSNDKAKSKEITIFANDLAKVNVKNLILDNPVTNKSKDGYEWITSGGHYRDNKTGERYDDFLFELPPQQVWGISGQWDPKIAEPDRTLDNIKGLQICYPLTSVETMKEPTPQEAALKKFLKEVLWQKGWDSMCEFDDKNLIDGPAGSACTSALKKKNPEYAMKPVFAYPLVQSKTPGQKKTADTSKPERMYIELVTFGEGEKLRCLTPIFGPGDKKMHWMKYLSTSSKPIVGIGHFICRWKGAYWGSHGSSTHGGSIKLEIVEMNFTPKSQTTLSYKRMLPANDAVEEKDDSHEGSEGDSSFRHPSGSGIVASDFAKPEDDVDKNVNNLMSSKNTTNNTNDQKTESASEDDQLESDGEGDDSEEERRKAAEEEAKRKKEKLEAARAKKKEMVAAKKAGKK